MKQVLAAALKAAEIVAVLVIASIFLAFLGILLDMAL